MISDLHFGLGSRSELEDFRWPHALGGFLSHVGAWGADQVDLVILGDLFELWQHPDVACRRQNRDQGCTDQEISAVVAEIARVHRPDCGCSASSQFVAPTTSGSFLAITTPLSCSDSVWGIIVAAIGASSDRVSQAEDGVWVSSDGRVVAEQGHQIGEDVNKFRDWPTVTAPCLVGGNTRSCLIKTWGRVLFSGSSTRPRLTTR